MKFLFDLFPVIVFFTTYYLAGGNKGGSCTITPGTPITQDPILLATALAILATVVQVGWLLARKNKVDGMLWVSLVLVALFGGATLVLRDPTFIQWKPTILYWTFALVFLVSPVFLRRPLVQTMLQDKITLPDRIWRRLNASWFLFFLVMGAVNLAVVYNFSCNAWVNFKFYGFTGLMLVFVLGQSLMLGRYVDNPGQSG